MTPTQEHGKLLAAMHEVKLSGEPDMPTGINVAQLALKHRQNKNQRQRIVVLVGSPLEGASSSEDALIKLAKKMKKNNVAIDVVAFGDALEYDSRLTAFIGAANSSDNSHFVTVPAGAGLLSDHIVSSNLLAEDGVGGGGGAGDGAGPSGAGAGGADDDGFGVDPNLDPELAMALRMSLEEERARVAASSSTGAAAPSLETIAEGSGSAAASTSAEALMDPDVVTPAFVDPPQPPPTERAPPPPLPIEPLIHHALDLQTRFPLDHAGIAAAELLGPCSCIFTWSLDGASPPTLSDEEAERVVAEGGEQVVRPPPVDGPPEDPRPPRPERRSVQPRPALPVLVAVLGLVGVVLAMYGPEIILAQANFRRIDRLASVAARWLQTVQLPSWATLYVQ